MPGAPSFRVLGERVGDMVLKPEQWQWSSYGDYALGEAGPLVNEAGKAKLRVRRIAR